MAKRYEDRYGRGMSGRDRDRAHDRGYMDRASDEVRSWFGDDDAERRRHMDEQRDRHYERGRGDADRWRNRDWVNRSGAPRPEYRGDWTNQQNWRRDDASRQDWNRGAWGGSATSDRDYRRDDDRDYSRDYNRDYGRSFESGDTRGGDWQWSDTNRGEWRDRESWNRSQAFGGPQREWSRQDRDWGGTTWDRDRDSNRDRSSGRSWSTDDGRTEFGGAHAGRGPKGYQRPDQRIHEDVCDRLTYADVDAENIEVAVSNGEVTLSGSVRNRWDKRRAEDVVEDVSGVRDVHNNIRVSREDRGIGMSNKSDSDQPGSVLGVNPTAGSQITNAPSGPKRS